MGELAPVAIAEEWNDLVVNLETAATVVPGDPESEQLVARPPTPPNHRRSAVKTWLLDNCGLDIPITTIAPQEQAPGTDDHDHHEHARRRLTTATRLVS